MNKKIKGFYMLILDNNVIAIDTNLKNFYEKLLAEDIGLTFSLSTLRTRFLESNRFNFTTSTGRVYWIQEILNNA